MSYKFTQIGQEIQDILDNALLSNRMEKNVNIVAKDTYGATVALSGIQQWDEQWELGRYDTTTGAPVNANNRIRSKNPIYSVPSTKYRFVGGGFTVCWYDQNDNFLSYSTPSVGDEVRTSPANAYIARFCMTSTYGTVYNYNLSVNFPSTEEGYCKYNGVAYPVFWKVEPDFRLIESITLTEDVTTFSRTQEPDTTPYNFKKLFVKITTPATTTQDKFYRITINGHLVGLANGTDTSKKVYDCSLRDASNGRIFCDRAYAHNAIGNNPQVTRMPASWGYYAVTSINSLSLTINEQDIPTGTAIDIYAVK